MQNDALDRGPYAKKIALDIIGHYHREKLLVRRGIKRERENIIFAISGKWGEGKSKLLDLLEKPLSQKRFKVIRFNPWKYSQEDIAVKRAFLRNLKTALKSKVDIEDLYFDRSKPVLLAAATRLIALPILTTLNLFIYFLLLLSIWPQIALTVITKLSEWRTTHQSAIDNSISILKSIWPILIVPLLLKGIVIDKRTANISTAEEFEGKFKEIIAGRKRLVILIDDLDRCDSKTTRLILDSLKTFFQHPECSYVITGDHTVIERFAAQQLELDATASPLTRIQQGRRYLKKLFDVYWRLPLATPKQFEGFLKKAIEDSGIRFSTEQQKANLATYLMDFELFERNPRNALRFLTRLKFALESIQIQAGSLKNTESDEAADSLDALNDILENPDLMARVLLIEEFFYPIYEELIVNPAQLIDHERFIRAGAAPTDLKGASVQKILEDPKDGKNEMEKYVKIIKFPPQFTAEGGTIVHEAAEYLSLSGSTGLPGTAGPDPEKFIEYLKNGQLSERLGASIGISKKEKRRKSIDTALGLFDDVAQDEKINILRECLKISATIDEWAEKLPEIKTKIMTLSGDVKEELIQYYLSTCLLRAPGLFEEFSTDEPTLFKNFWKAFGALDVRALDNGQGEFIKPFVLAVHPFEDPAPYAVFVEKFPEIDISREYRRELNNFDKCHQTLLKIQEKNIKSENLSKWLNEKVEQLAATPENFTDAIQHKDLLRQIGIFDKFKSQSLKLAAGELDVDLISKIVSKKDELELATDEEDWTQAILKKILSSKKYTLLENESIVSLLTKENKIELFDKLVNLAMSGALVRTRIEVLSKTIRSFRVWDGINPHDIEDSLKKLRLVNARDRDLISTIHKVIDSWA
jgi:hypothetical protein